MASWRSNDYTNAFGCAIFALCAPGIVNPKFVVDLVNNIFIGKIFRFLEPLPAISTSEISSLYRIIFSLGASIGLITFSNAENETFVKGSFKSLTFFSLSLIGNIAVGHLR